MIFAAAPSPSAAQDETYEPTVHEGDEELAGFLIGTSAGLIAGGVFSVFYRNQDSDRNITTILIASSVLGAAAGTIWDVSLPDDAIENEGLFSWNAREGLRAGVPSIGAAFGPDGLPSRLDAAILTGRF
ncbi:MAG: hypothetical protein M5R36_00915 [Deltaproteobacteria bacterium]|nr:hypothetical protein [Deltaproteobacteria bacterium]